MHVCHSIGAVLVHLSPSLESCFFKLIARTLVSESKIGVCWQWLSTIPTCMYQLVHLCLLLLWLLAEVCAVWLLSWISFSIALSLWCLLMSCGGSYGKSQVLSGHHWLSCVWHLGLSERLDGHETWNGVSRLNLQTTWVTSFYWQPICANFWQFSQ